jgi:hypothetical protein
MNTAASETRSGTSLQSSPTFESRPDASATIPSSMFAVSRSCAPSAATSQKIRLYSTEVRPSAKPAAIQAHIPAMEIAFGDTFGEASQAVADCAHFRFRVAMGRRSIAFAADSFIADGIHNSVEER